MVTHNRLPSDEQGNKGEGKENPVKGFIDAAKMALAGQQYKELALDCSEKATDARRCSCATCSIVAATETALSAAAMMGCAACNGHPEMLKDLISFLDTMRAKYPVGGM